MRSETFELMIFWEILKLTWCCNQLWHLEMLGCDKCVWNVLKSKWKNFNYHLKSKAALIAMWLYSNWTKLLILKFSFQFIFSIILQFIFPRNFRKQVENTIKLVLLTYIHLNIYLLLNKYVQVPDTPVKND